MTDGGAPAAQISQLPVQFGLDAVLLDVREDDEWQRGHAPGAQHIPMGDVPARLGELDAEKDLYVICHVGGRSQRVAIYLQRNGYDAINVDGGMLAWTGVGRPVVTDDGSPGAI
jgi:rhodanese-related sulfurtransferase